LITYLLGLSFTANTWSQKVITTVTILDKKAYQGFISYLAGLVIQALFEEKVY